MSRVILSLNPKIPPITNAINHSSLNNQSETMTNTLGNMCYSLNVVVPVYQGVDQVISSKVVIVPRGGIFKLRVWTSRVIRKMPLTTILLILKTNKITIWLLLKEMTIKKILMYPKAKLTKTDLLPHNFKTIRNRKIRIFLKNSI